MKICFKPVDTFIVRQPYFPINVLFEILEDSTKASSLFSSDTFRRSILWVSSDLYTEFEKYLKGKLKDKDCKRMYLTLFKYAIRMSSRSTPFGEFASIGSGSISEFEKLNHPFPYERTVYLDALFENSICNRILKDMPTHDTDLLPYSLNGSIVQKGDCFIYLNSNKQGSVYFSSLAYNSIIAFLLKIKKKVYTRETLFKILNQKFEIQEGQLMDFIDSLINNNIIIPAIKPEAMEDTWLNRVMPYLSGKSAVIVSEIRDCLKKIELNDSISIIGEFLIRLRSYGFENSKKLKNVVQTICYSKTKQHISREIIDKVKKTIVFFSKISHKSNVSNNLSQFIREFQKRYESQKIPLIEVLNPEIGIGYGHSIYPKANMIEYGVVSKRQISNSSIIIQDPVELLLQKKMLESDGKSIRLNCTDVSDLEDNISHLPPTMAACFNLNGENGEIISELHFSGCSATRLLGRFTLGNPNIRRLTEKIAACEDDYYKNNGDVYEINLLPNLRSGNVNYRSKFRKYRICSIHGAKDSDVVLADILVSIEKGMVVLTRKDNGKRIIPRLSSAHNNYAGTDSIYQFLGDIQSQSEISSMIFSWGSLRLIYNHFPRVYFEDIIISLEEWTLNVNSIKKGTKVSLELLMTWIKNNHIPRFFKLIEGDNELIVDIKNEASVKIFIDEIKDRNSVFLRESIEMNQACKLKKIQYCNQIILPIFKYLEND